MRDRLDDLSVLYADASPFDAESRRLLTDGERAACLWLLHMRLYVDFVRQHPGARCRSLDFAHFLARPSETLEAVARLFGVAHEPGEIEAALDAETGVHSKERQTRFTAADRRAALRSASEQHRDDIVAGLVWAERHGTSFSISDAPLLAVVE